MLITYICKSFWGNYMYPSNYHFICNVLIFEMSSFSIYISLGLQCPILQQKKMTKVPRINHFLNFCLFCFSSPFLFFLIFAQNRTLQFPMIDLGDILKIKTDIVYRMIWFLQFFLLDQKRIFCFKQRGRLQICS